MKASLIQVNIGVLSQVLQGLYEEYGNMRAERKRLYAVSDNFLSNAAVCDLAEVDSNIELYKANKEMGELYTKYIRKYKARLKAIEAVQKALKHELKCQQCLDSMMADGDEDWLQRAFWRRRKGLLNRQSCKRF